MNRESGGIPTLEIKLGAERMYFDKKLSTAWSAAYSELLPKSSLKALFSVAAEEVRSRRRINSVAHEMRVGWNTITGNNTWRGTEVSR